MPHLAQRGLTMVEFLIATVMLMVFILSWLEWSSIRAAQARRMHLMDQIEHVRTAAIQYALDEKRRPWEDAAGSGTPSVARYFWPSDHSDLIESAQGVSGTDTNQGIIDLFEGGYLSPSLASVYPGSRWVFLEKNPCPGTNLPSDPPACYDDLGRTLYAWLVIRYEAPAEFGYLQDFRIISGTMGLWSQSHAGIVCTSDLSIDYPLEGDPDPLDSSGSVISTESGDSSELDESLSAPEGCDAIDIYVAPDANFLSREISPTVADVGVEELQSFLYNQAEDQTICLENSLAANGARSCAANKEITVSVVNLNNSSLLRFKTISVGAAAAEGIKVGASEKFDVTVRGRAVATFNNLVYPSSHRTSAESMDLRLDNWHTLYDKHRVGTTAEGAVSSENIAEGAVYEYFDKISGLYAEDVAVGRPVSRGHNRQGSRMLSALRTGIGFSRYKEFSFSGSRLLPTHANGEKEFYIHTQAETAADYHDTYKVDTMDWNMSSDDLPSYMEQPEYQVSWSNSANRWQGQIKKVKRYRPVTALNMGYAGFNTAVLGSDGLYVSNLQIGDTMHRTGTGSGQKHHSYPSYFSEFRLTNVTIRAAQNNGDFTDPCIRRVGRFDKDFLQACSDAIGEMDDDPTAASYHNFRNVGLMGGLVRRSDARLKSDVRPLEVAPGGLSGIRAHQYSRRAKNADDKEIGFVAQQVNQYYPELVQKDARGYLSVSYEGMVPVLWGHLRELAGEDAEARERLRRKLALLQQRLGTEAGDD